jgi:hypothetical protein
MLSGNQVHTAPNRYTQVNLKITCKTKLKIGIYITFWTDIPSLQGKWKYKIPGISETTLGKKMKEF